jgi:hypothetical protein
MPALNVVVPSCPKPKELQNAHVVLQNAFNASQSFFQSFDTVRAQRKAKGNSTDSEQDLLRAGLVFAAAGLDAMIKQLVRDALSAVIRRNRAAREQFADFVERRLQKPTSAGEKEISPKYLASVLVQDNPGEFLLSDHIRELTGSSLQSKDEVLRAAACFAITASEVTQDPNRLKEIFTVRNQITHEMDIHFDQNNRTRRQRKSDHMAKHAEEILRVAVKFFNSVAARL